MPQTCENNMLCLFANESNTYVRRIHFRVPVSLKIGPNEIISPCISQSLRKRTLPDHDSRANLKKRNVLHSSFLPIFSYTHRFFLSFFHPVILLSTFKRYTFRQIIKVITEASRYHIPLDYNVSCECSHLN